MGEKCEMLEKEIESLTLKELSRIFCLSKGMETDRRHLEELRAKAKAPDSESAAARYAIKSLEAVIESKQRQFISESPRLEEFISGIDDSLTRQIFLLRCADGMGWREVAEAVGGGCTIAGARKRFYRHLKKIGIE
jgi:hypothetical protein